MPYVITEACIGVKDKSCVDVCPVDCIYEGEQMLFIHPDECIDCGACEPECPVTAIFPEEDVPGNLRQYIEMNRDSLQGRKPAGPSNQIGRRSQSTPASRLLLPRCVTLDYWDTIYEASSTPDRVRRRHDALQLMLQRIGADVPAEEFSRLYHASAVEAERWWRDEHRGYTTADRIRWLLAQLAIDRPRDCEHIARAVEVVDETLTSFPPPLLPGAADGIRTLASRFKLAIVSDTGFASGRAQDRLLAQDGLLQYFTATIYSMDVGHSKPRPEPFQRALEAAGRHLG